ncbi:MAG: bifunctional 2-polyprenyl-6-hydroxyphenol methylase/3-demethylubiquinol 3-O-methyltransferase UbiG [Rickettsiales bacterium]|nr:bifunctional 2-polyprenyl-6-hydroxyphenol methylase/3-demethylubiquinol 3-O-methyltransferase UbiG [Rickettsiales bacterium]
MNRTNTQGSVDNEDVERFSRIAEEWWDERGKFLPLHQINPVRLRYIREQIEARFGRSADGAAPLTGLTLLDIGCGGGLIAEPLSRLGAAVTGIDASEKNIQVAGAHAKNMSLTIDYRATTAEALSQSVASFDVVLALEVIEHVADVPFFLETIAALVKPGGLLIITTLNRTLKSLLMAKIGAEYILRWLPIGTHDWQQFLRPSEIIAPLQSLGLSHTDLCGMVFSPLKNQWRLDASDVTVNYLVSFHKPRVDSQK